jgi:hypothetical protein
MSRYETTLLTADDASLTEAEPIHDALLAEVVETLHDPELAKIRLPESLHSILYISQPSYKYYKKEDITQKEVIDKDLTEDFARKEWVADIALTSLWFYAVNRRENDPEHMRRNHLVEMITQIDDPQITDVFVENEINNLINEHLVKQIPALLDPSSIDQAHDYTLSLNFDRVLFEGLKEELEWRRLHDPQIPSDIPHINLAS